MPELPDVAVYIEALERFIGGRVIGRAVSPSVSLLRTYDPPLESVEGRAVTGFRRMGKRIVWEVEGDLFMVFHLMVAGRFHWRKPEAALPKKTGLAAFGFEHGTLHLTEQGARKRASLHIGRGEGSLAEHDRGGLEPLSAGRDDFARALTARNRTLKRALTDPRTLSGVGNAYSDEILHRARLSPLKLTSRLTDAELTRLHRSTGAVLREWTDRLRAETGEGFPGKVTAFRPEMAVHGKYGSPCPACETPVARIVYKSNETNYCPACQTGGRLLADRSLSRLLKDDWPPEA